MRSIFRYDIIFPGVKYLCAKILLEHLSSLLAFYFMLNPSMAYSKPHWLFLPRMKRESQRWRCKPNIFIKFSNILHENEENWTRAVCSCVPSPPDPPPVTPVPTMLPRGEEKILPSQDEVILGPNQQLLFYPFVLSCNHLFSTQAFRPIELKLLSTQNVELENYSYRVLMRTTGEIVFVRYAAKDDGSFLYLYTVQQGGSLNKENKIKFPCDAGHRLSIHCLLIQILWREYLAISCKECRDIKLVDLDTNKITPTYSDEQPMGKMCKGWHKIYVQVPSGFVELDCSSTKFTKLKQIGSGKEDIPELDDLCYVPSPHNRIVAVQGLKLHVTSLDETDEITWDDPSKKVVDGREIQPQGVIYSPRFNALLVVDAINKIFWVLNPATGEILQNIDWSEIGFSGAKGFIRGSQLVMACRGPKIHYFSFN